MAVDHCPLDCVIASSNRFTDLEPYCIAIWKADQQTWASILPWEFPQNASREDEEAYVRKYFSEREIHMQGGAHGKGAMV